MDGDQSPLRYVELELIVIVEDEGVGSLEVLSVSSYHDDGSDILLIFFLHLILIILFWGLISIHI